MTTVNPITLLLGDGKYLLSTCGAASDGVAEMPGIAIAELHEPREPGHIFAPGEAEADAPFLMLAFKDARSARVLSLFAEVCAQRLDHITAVQRALAALLLAPRGEA